MDYKLDHSLWSRAVGRTQTKAYYSLIYGLLAQPFVDQWYMGLVCRLTPTIVKLEVFLYFFYVLEP